MLAKIWKKLLMAILIIACLYNITAKLVNKLSLEDQLNIVKEEESITEFVTNLHESVEKAITTGVVEDAEEIDDEIQNTENTDIIN